MEKIPGYLNGGFKHNKYIITKSNGNPIDPKAKYFVLRYDKDPHARSAMLTYSRSISQENEQFAADIMKELDAI